MSQKLVVITGAAQGIGRALSEKYLTEGYQVLAIDWNLAELEKIKQEKRPSNKYEIYHMDVTQASAYTGLKAKLQEWQWTPDIWINNAGIAIVERFEQMSLSDFDRVMDVNVKGVAYGTHAALELMKNPERGKIVNVSSVNGIIPAPYMSAYSASKHAVIGFTRCVQEELQIGHSAIELLLVLPGFVDIGVFYKGVERFKQPWLNKLASPLDTCVNEIFQGIQAGHREIYPTFNGRIMKALHRYFPLITKKAGHYVLAKNWREFLGLDPIKR